MSPKPTSTFTENTGLAGNSNRNPKGWLAHQQEDRQKTSVKTGNKKFKLKSIRSEQTRLEYSAGVIRKENNRG